MVELSWVNSWVRCNDAREVFKEDGDKRWIHALGFQSVDQEELEVFHQMGLYIKKGAHRSSSYVYPSFCDKQESPEAFYKKGILMISLSEERQFSAEDIYEIPAGVGRSTFEFDTNLIKACHPLFQSYPSNQLLAKHLIRDRVILKSDMNLSTQDALNVRFKTRKASLSFIHRLNTYLLKCMKQRQIALETLRRREKEAQRFQKELGTHPTSVA